MKRGQHDPLNPSLYYPNIAQGGGVMSEIPTDILATARAAFSEIATVDWIEAEIVIARAVFAERERCARIAQACVIQEQIASAIRNPQSLLIPTDHGSDGPTLSPLPSNTQFTRSAPLGGFGGNPVKP